MFKKYLLSVIFTLAIYGLEAFEIPHSFLIDTPLAYTTGVMDIQKDGMPLGLIKREIYGNIWSGRIPQYDLYSSENGFEAAARVDSSNLKYRVIFSIKDQNDCSIGRLEENWENAYFSYNPIIEIYSANQELLAIGQANSQGTSVTLIDPLDHHVLISLLSGGTFILGNWSVVIEDPQLLHRFDTRLLVLSLSLLTDQSFHYKLCNYLPPLAS